MITYLILVGIPNSSGLRSVLALLVGAVVFTTLNLFMLTLILLAAEGVPPRELLEEQWALSLGMAVGLGRCRDRGFVHRAEQSRADTVRRPAGDRPVVRLSREFGARRRP